MLAVQLLNHENDENIDRDIDIDFDIATATDWDEPHFDIATATLRNARLQPRAPFADIVNQVPVVRMQQPAAHPPQPADNTAAPPERLLMTPADWVSHYLY